MTEKNHQISRKIIVDVLVIVFASSSWVAINGLWVQLPVMFDKLPEGWNLSSYIVVTCQLANLGPILFSAARHIFSQKVLEVPTIHVTFSIGVISCILLSGLWNKTTVVGGKDHSTALLSLAFFLAFVDCTSSVLYLPFMTNFREIYIISFLIGEGMSGVLPSIFALCQGVGGNPECWNVSYANVTEDGNVTEYRIEAHHSDPRFSSDVFFMILAGIILLSWGAFFLLRFLPQAKEETVRPMPVTHPPNPAVAESYMVSCTPETSCSSETLKSSCQMSEERRMKNFKFYVLLGVQCYVSILHNGVLLSVQTYSCQPYGNIAYHLAVSLSSIANPVCCFVAMFYRVSKLKPIILLTVCSCVSSGYILTTAILSPTPPLVEHISGAVLVVVSWIAFVGNASFIKACIATVLREECEYEALFWYGVVTQAGSAIGAVVTFILVNVADIFQAYQYCAS